MRKAIPGRGRAPIVAGFIVAVLAGLALIATHRTPSARRAGARRHPRRAVELGHRERAGRIALDPCQCHPARQRPGAR